MAPNSTAAEIDFMDNYIDSVPYSDPATSGISNSHPKSDQTMHTNMNVDENELVEEIKSQSRKEFSTEYVISLRKYYVEKIQAEFRKLLKKQGDVSAAIYYSEIKNIIKEVYEKFSYLPNEEGFLHIIGIINSSILQNKWQQYSETQAKNVEDALKVCYKNSEITMKDIFSITKRMNDLGIDTIPIETE